MITQQTGNHDKSRGFTISHQDRWQNCELLKSSRNLPPFSPCILRRGTAKLPCGLPLLRLLFARSFRGYLAAIQQTSDLDELVTWEVEAEGSGRRFWACHGIGSPGLRRAARWGVGGSRFDGEASHGILDRTLKSVGPKLGFLMYNLHVLPLK